jgi:hypothetical protein
MTVYLADTKPHVLPLPDALAEINTLTANAVVSHG